MLLDTASKSLRGWSRINVLPMTLPVPTEPAVPDRWLLLKPLTWMQPMATLHPSRIPEKGQVMEILPYIAYPPKVQVSRMWE
ncbi:hypothetical protein KC357_g248 [Hortaea werneckii]|nr:hypothetical protein KC357_g248 [Hortaea werneckii]